MLGGRGLPQGIVHIVYPTRCGMLPAVRALVEFLAEAFMQQHAETTPGAR